MTTTLTGVGETLNAGQMLREDHRRIKALFREFEAADEETKPSIAMRAIEEIELHALIEEECFYPAFKKATRDVDAVLEASEAHHAAKTLIAELKLTPAGRRFNAKFLTLAKSVAHHIKEEEETMLPVAERSGLDLAALAQDMAAVKYGRLSGALVSDRSGFGLAGMLAAGALAGLGWLLLSRRD